MTAATPVAERVVATSVPRARKRPVRCSRCSAESTHHVTVTAHQQPRRGWAACEPCAPHVAAAGVLEVLGADPSLAADATAPAPAPTATAVPAAPSPAPADAQTVAAAATWWSGIDVGSLDAAARGHFDNVLEGTQWTPDSSQLVALAQDVAADVAGLGRDMPAPGPERTMWLLCWSHADAWAHAAVDRLVQGTTS